MGSQISKRTMTTNSDFNGTSRLINHFNASSVMNQGSGWCALWQSNESDLWDRGKPSPPLIELVLVCLEFPLYKDPELPGPPWGLTGVHWDLLARGGNGLLKHSVREESSAGLEGQFLRVLDIKPEVSYENGKGTDMLSVWRKKS